MTDWNTDAPHDVDWACAEHRLGTALPADYKEFVAAFGQGLFGYDAYLSWLAIHVPDADHMSRDLIRRAAYLSAVAARCPGTGRWEQFSPFPAAGGLLQWATTERGHGFYWLIDGRDPNRWPVPGHNRDDLRWHRFDGLAIECVFRLLTDPALEFSEAAGIDRPWFGRIAPANLCAIAS